MTTGLTLRQFADSDSLKTELVKVLKNGKNTERMMRIGLTCALRNPLLLKASPYSYGQAMLDLAAYNLDPDGKHAAIVPYKTKDGVIAQLVIMYQGMVALAYRSGKVAKIHADVVCENDEFVYEMGEVVSHRIDFRQKRGDVYAAYAQVVFKDGSKKAEVMTKEEIESIRKRSRAGSNGPWVTDWNEMAKKTAFRRLAKWLPLSDDARELIEKDDQQFEHHEAPAAPRQAYQASSQLDALMSEEPDDDEARQILEAEASDG